MEEFLSTPSARRATYELRRENQQYKRFLSTPSARRATRQDSRQKLGHTISIHALREEGDGGILFRPVMAADDFYPRPPRGGRRAANTPLSTVARNFYPRPPRGGRRAYQGRHHKGITISIHALREEGDTSLVPVLTLPHEISIHALREEGDRTITTSSASFPHISIHALREEGDGRWTGRPGGWKISIHALREEGDPGYPAQALWPCQISIHALREEGDDEQYLAADQEAIFLSTPSARRATSASSLRHS